MKKGSDVHLAYKHQEKNQGNDIGYYESYLEKEKKKLIKQYNVLAKYDFRLWNKFNKDLKYIIIMSYKASLKAFKEGNRNDIFYSFGGGEIFPIKEKMRFIDFLHYLFSVKNGEEPYRTIELLEEYRVDYRDMKIDMILG